MKTCLPFVGALALLLAACAPAPVQPTPEQLAQMRLNTLNIYDDNTVAVRVARPSKKSQYFDSEPGATVFDPKKPVLKTKSEDLLVFEENKDEALVYSTGAEYYNAKDLLRIVKDPRGLEIAFVLKNGAHKNFPAAQFGILWCNRDKVCRSTGSTSMRGFYENQLDVAEKFKTTFKLSSGDDVLPTFMESEIVVLSDAEYVQFEARIKRVTAGGEGNLARVSSAQQMDDFHQSLVAAARAKLDQEAQDRAKGKKVVPKVCPPVSQWSRRAATALVLNGCDPAAVERYFTRGD